MVTWFPFKFAVIGWAECESLLEVMFPDILECWEVPTNTSPEPANFRASTSAMARSGVDVVVLVYALPLPIALWMLLDV